MRVSFGADTAGFSSVLDQVTYGGQQRLIHQFGNVQDACAQACPIIPAGGLERSLAGQLSLRP